MMAATNNIQLPYVEDTGLDVEKTMRTQKRDRTIPALCRDNP